MRVETKERPILFSGEMVRAILDGRKTQTRRVINRVSSIGVVTEFQESDTHGYDWTFRDSRMRWNDFDNGELIVRCPYGKPGDRLYVRESVCLCQCQPDCVDHILYRESDLLPRHSRWTPSIHMPRWASRITLEITDVRVQRVQEISSNDCRSEGVRSILRSEQSFIDGFSRLWDSINQKRGFGWDTNPWVWALTFKRLEPAK